MKIRFLLLFALAAFMNPEIICAQVPVGMPMPPVYGTVSSSGRPLGGVTLSLFHPVVGRSAPVFSRLDGSFFFPSVPPQAQPYLIEAYWGNQLLFQGQLFYHGQPVPVNIQLP